MCQFKMALHIVTKIEYADITLQISEPKKLVRDPHCIVTKM